MRRPATRASTCPAGRSGISSNIATTANDNLSETNRQLVEQLDERGAPGKRIAPATRGKPNRPVFPIHVLGRSGVQYRFATLQDSRPVGKTRCALRSAFCSSGRLPWVVSATSAPRCCARATGLWTNLVQLRRPERGTLGRKMRASAGAWGFWLETKRRNSYRE